MVTANEVSHAMREMLKNQKTPFAVDISVEEGKERFSIHTTIDKYAELLALHINFERGKSIHLQDQKK